MPEFIPEFVPGSAEAIQRLFLWQAVEETFKSHPFTLGVRLYPMKSHAHMVLASEPYDGYEDYTYIIKLWGKWISGLGLVRSLIVFEDIKNGAELYQYELSPKTIIQHAVNGSEATMLDDEDLQLLREDINEVTWSRVLSEQCARSVHYLL